MGAPQLATELAFPSEKNTGTAVLHARFSPDGRKVATLTARVIRLLDAITGRNLLSISNKIILGQVEFSPDGERLFVFGSGAAQLWDANSGAPIGSTITNGGRIFRAKFSPDGSRIATYPGNNHTEDYTARIWDGKTGQPVGVPLEHKYIVLAVDFSPDSRRIVTGSGDRTARVWDAQTGAPLTPPLLHAEHVEAVRYAPDGRTIVTASIYSALFWNAETGEQLEGRLDQNSSVNALEFSTDGTKILTGSSDGSARVWDARSRQPLTPSLAHGGPVLDATFSPDGKRVVTAAADQTVRVWDAATGQPVFDALKHESPVPFARFSPDGQRVLTVSRDAARIWDIPPLAAPAPDWLAPLAEAIAGQSVRAETSRTNETRTTLASIRSRLQQAPETPWRKWGLWLLSDPRDRTISPLTRLQLEDHIEKALRHPTELSLEGIQRLAHGNADLLSRIAEARERLESGRRAERIYNSGTALRLAGQDAEGLARMIDAAELGFAPAQNSVAWTLATSSDDTVRDGRRAVDYASKAVAASDRRSPSFLDTLAVAYAETGDFTNAVLTLQEALLLPSLSPILDKELKAHLESFKAGKPWRED